VRYQTGIERTCRQTDISRPDSHMRIRRIHMFQLHRPPSRHFWLRYPVFPDVSHVQAVHQEAGLIVPPTPPHPIRQIRLKDKSKAECEEERAMEARKRKHKRTISALARSHPTTTSTFSFFKKSSISFPVSTFAPFSAPLESRTKGERVGKAVIETRGFRDWI